MVAHHTNTNHNTDDSDSSSDVNAAKYGSTADWVTDGDTSPNDVANHGSDADTDRVTDDFPNTASNYTDCRPVGDKNDTNSGSVGDLSAECDQRE